MTGRLLSSIVLIVACWLPRSAHAQSMPWTRGQPYTNVDLPISHANMPGDPQGATSYPSWGQPPFSGGALYPNDTVDGDVYAYGQPGHMGYPDAYGQGLGTGPNYPPGVAPGVGYRPDFSPQYAAYSPLAEPNPRAETIFQMLPADRGLLYDEDIQFIKSRRDAWQGAWLRMEYISFRTKDPGKTLLGAPIDGIDDPRLPFVVQVLDPVTGNLNAVGEARVADLDPIDLENMNGTKLSFGVPTDNGEWGGLIWGLASTSRFRAGELVESPNGVNLDVNPNAQFIATSLLDNGVPSSLLILYDRDFRVTWDVETWGAEANIFRNLREPVDGWLLQASYGFRYMQHIESLLQQGSFDNRSSLDVPDPIIVNQFDPPVDNGIFSETQNRLYALQVGLRSEIRNRWLAVGVEPKIAFGANIYDAEVITSNLRDSPLPPLQDDGFVKTRLRRTEFAPVGDLGLYARVNPTDWLSLQIGYNIMMTTNIARPDETIYYNDQGLANPPAVVVRPDTETFWMQGISIGGQLTMPRR
jgi:hypothetical protein